MAYIYLIIGIVVLIWIGGRIISFIEPVAGFVADIIISIDHWLNKPRNLK